MKTRPHNLPTRISEWEGYAVFSTTTAIVASEVPLHQKAYLLREADLSLKVLVIGIAKTNIGYFETCHTVIAFLIRPYAMLF